METSEPHPSFCVPVGIRGVSGNTCHLFSGYFISLWRPEVYSTGSRSVVRMASGEEGSHVVSDSIVTEFATYEDFLDSQITPTDLYYLEVQ